MKYVEQELPNYVYNLEKDVNSREITEIEHVLSGETIIKVEIAKHKKLKYSPPILIFHTESGKAISMRQYGVDYGAPDEVEFEELTKKGE